MTDADRLFDLLKEAGWKRRGAELVAPHGTIWLDGAAPWAGAENGEEFLADMRGRLTRILANRENLGRDFEESWSHSYDDTTSLVRSLETVLATGEEST